MSHTYNGHERAFGQYVCSRNDLIGKHIEKHDLYLDQEEYLAIGDLLSQGERGVFAGNVYGHMYEAVVYGTVEKDGKKYGILRTVHPTGKRKKELIKKISRGEVKWISEEEIARRRMTLEDIVEEK